jgi:hypothetical protein
MVDQTANDIQGAAQCWSMIGGKPPTHRVPSINGVELFSNDNVAQI